jgi:quercetin dioxygenase-like cupin family protein
MTCETPLPHPGEEATLVLTGRMEIQVGSDRYLLEEGDCIYYYASVPHKIVNIGDGELIFVSAITPPSF